MPRGNPPSRGLMKGFMMLLACNGTALHNRPLRFGMIFAGNSQEAARLPGKAEDDDLGVPRFPMARASTRKRPTCSPRT